MYECRVQAGFSAAHQLRLADGALEPVHGHDWKVEVVFRGALLDRTGVLVDFIAAEKALHQVVAVLDHTSLNECPGRLGLNPTAEHVARWIFDKLRERMGAEAPPAAVYVTEAPGCVAAYLADS